MLQRLVRKVKGFWQLTLASWRRDGSRGEDSVRHYQRALELCPGSAWFWYYAGTSHGQKGWPGHDQEKSIECLRQATKLAPRRAMYWQILCYHLMHFRRYDEAAKEIKALRDIKPKLAGRLATELVDCRYAATWRE